MRSVGSRLVGVVMGRGVWREMKTWFETETPLEDRRTKKHQQYSKEMAVIMKRHAIVEVMIDAYQ